MKTDNLNFRNLAIQAFDQEDYPLVLSLLSQMEASSAWKVLTNDRKKKDEPTRWLKNKEFDQFFWNSGLNSDLFRKLVSSDIGDQVLFRYFNREASSISPLPLDLINSSLPACISAIRSSQAFIGSGWENLIDDIPLPEKFIAHKHFWERSRKIEAELWGSVESALLQVQGMKASDIWCDLVLFMERERFKYDDERHTYFLTRTYGGLIEFLGSKGIFEGLEKETMKSLQTNLLKKVRPSWRQQSNGSIEKSPVETLALHFYYWLHFKENVIDLYSFSHQFEPILKNNELTLSTTPKEHYQFLVDGARYHLNELKYFIKAESLVEQGINSGKMNIRRGQMPHDHQLNHFNAITTSSITLFLSDMGIQEIGLNGRKNSLSDWIMSIVNVSRNRSFRYDWPMAELTRNNIPWDDAFMLYIAENEKKGTVNIPIEAYTENSFANYILRATSELQIDAINLIAQAISFSARKSFEFNRFDLQYDPWKQPFMRVNESLFVPTFLLATNGWFYSLAQITLENQKYAAPDRKETREMEGILIDAFSQKPNWKSELLAETSVRMDGDVDIQVHDGSDTLWIQLKRVYFRLTPKARNNEKLQSETKAAFQLNLAEATLLNDGVNGLLEQPPTKKWIVSTSFENIGSSISGCIKINYFELLRALYNPEITSLKQLEEHLLKNQELQQFCNMEFGGIKGVGLEYLLPNVKEMLMPFNHNAYNIPIHNSNEEGYSNVNKAIKARNEGNTLGAYDILEQHVKTNTEDVDAWAELANLQADLKNFNRAFMCFEKALELQPDCPDYMRNYGLACFEAGKFDKGFEIYLKLYELYPLLPIIRIEIIENWTRIVSIGGLSEASYALIYEKMKQLGLI